LALVALTLAGATPAAWAAAAAPTPPGSVPLAYASDGSSITVRPLDDPANPYRGQYGDIERWVYGHAESFDQWKARGLAEQQALLKASGGSPPAAMPPTSVFLDVNAAGWPLPRSGRDTDRSWQTQPGTPEEILNRQYGRSLPPPTEKRYFIPAPLAGLPASLNAELTEEQERQRLFRQPRIPAWLGTRPPLSAVFMPNGEIVTYGELNLHYTAPAGYAHSELSYLVGEPVGETWYRYSADGKLLGTVQNTRAHYADWHSLYWPQMQATLDAFPRDGKQLSTNFCGYWIGLTDPLSWHPPGQKVKPAQVYAAWSYDGQPLDLNAAVPAELAGYQQMLGQRDLTELYALEVKYGPTGRLDPSPYEGQPDGPQVVDPAPRPWPVTAGSMSDSAQFIRVMPREAEANPYRGQYTGWDEWAWRQHNAPRPDAVKMSAGDALPQAEPVNFYSPWREVWLAVDANGALEPLAQSGLAEARAKLDYDRRDLRAQPWRFGSYQFYAAGELDSAQWAQFMAQKLQLTDSLYPAIPQWLAGQPVAEVVFVPNGDVITNGPLGSFDTAPDTKYDDRFKAGRSGPWYVYNADGQPKGTVPPGQEWMGLYRAPGLRAQLEADKAAGRYVQGADGYTLVFAGPPYTRGADNRAVWADPQLLAAYDWDGTPLDVTQPLTRRDFRCIMLEWHEVQWLNDTRALGGAPQAQR
jgi:hypothetical protein